MKLMRLIGCVTLGLSGAVAHAAGGDAASPAAIDLMDAALCKPPFSLKVSRQFYEAAEKFGEADTSMFGVAQYKLPQPLQRDGFTANTLFIAVSAYGVFIDGLQADALAKKYQLNPEESSIVGSSSKGYSRVVVADTDEAIEPGLVQVVARESESIPNKTMLACEFVSTANQEALRYIEESGKEREKESLAAAAVLTPSAIRQTHGGAFTPEPALQQAFSKNKTAWRSIEMEAYDGYESKMEKTHYLIVGKRGDGALAVVADDWVGIEGFYLYCGKKLTGRFGVNNSKELKQELAAPGIEKLADELFQKMEEPEMKAELQKLSEQEKQQAVGLIFSYAYTPIGIHKDPGKSEVLYKKECPQ